MKQPNTTFPDKKITKCYGCEIEKECIRGRTMKRYICQECRIKIGNCRICGINREDCAC